MPPGWPGAEDEFAGADTTPRADSQLSIARFSCLAPGDDNAGKLDRHLPWRQRAWRPISVRVRTLPTGCACPNFPGTVTECAASIGLPVVVPLPLVGLATGESGVGIGPDTEVKVRLLAY